MGKKEITIEEVLNHIEMGITATGQSDSYCVGFCNALVWLKSCITHEEPQFFEDMEVSKCTDCNEYNQEKHYCPKFCDVIRDTTKEIQDFYRGEHEKLERIEQIVDNCDSGMIGTVQLFLRIKEVLEQE